MGAGVQIGAQDYIGVGIDFENLQISFQIFDGTTYALKSNYTITDPSPGSGAWLTTRNWMIAQKALTGVNARIYPYMNLFFLD